MLYLIGQQQCVIDRGLVLLDEHLHPFRHAGWWEWYLTEVPDSRQLSRKWTTSPELTTTNAVLLNVGAADLIGIDTVAALEASRV